MATVFISHSAWKDDVAVKYVEAIRDALEEADHEVLLDRDRLTSGDDWNAVIVNWMYLCDAAVVLFSENALKSSYVLFEISNLVGRLRREINATGSGVRPVRICPALVPGMDIDRIKAGFFGAIKGDLLHTIGPNDSPKALALDLLKAIPNTSSSTTGLDELVTLIAAILVGRDPELLVAAASDAGLTLKPRTAPVDYPRRLARHLLTSRLGVVMAAAQKLQPVLGSELTYNIIDLVAPSWVSPEAAEELREMLVVSTETKQTPGESHAAPSTYRCAVINGDRADFTPEMYLRRARRVLKIHAGAVVQVNPPNGVNTVAAILEEVRSALASEFDVDTDEDPDQIEAALAEAIQDDLEQLKQPVLVVLSRGAMQEQDYVALLESLQKQAYLTHVTFVAMWGAAIPGDATSPAWRRVLSPPLAEGQEQSARRAYRTIVERNLKKASAARF